MSQPSRARFKSRPPPQTWMREIDMVLRILKGKVQPNISLLSLYHITSSDISPEEIGTKVFNVTIIDLIWNGWMINL